MNEITRQWRFGYICALQDVKDRVKKERLVDNTDPNLVVECILTDLWTELGEDDEE